jgi:hypothetical protein
MQQKQMSPKPELSFHFSSLCSFFFRDFNWGVMIGMFSCLYRLNRITSLPLWGIFVLKGLSNEMNLSFDDMYG